MKTKGLVNFSFMVSDKMRYVDFALGTILLGAGVYFNSIFLLISGGISLGCSIFNPYPKFVAFIKSRIVRGRV